MFLLFIGCQPQEAIPLPPGPSGVPAAPVEQVPATDCAQGAPQTLLLSEIVASNLDGVVDEDGQTSDWFELRNDGAQPVALAGWSLQDEGDNVWTFAAGQLDAGGLLQVWASEKDRQGKEGLHTSFSLSSADGALALIRPDGCEVDRAAWEHMGADVALGRSPGEGTWVWFVEPTPGAANTTAARPGFSAAPIVSPEGGVVDAPEVTISGAGVIRYTLDGSLPGPEDQVYTKPFTVPTDQGPRVLRARAWEDGLWPGPATTVTWFGDHGAFDPGLMVVSLVVDPDDFFSEERGIWAYGTDYEPYYPYFGANFWQGWERRVHVSVFSADRALVVDQDAGIQIHGGYSRAFDQRGLRLLARAGWGSAAAAPETFDHAFFPEEENAAFHSLVLHNGGDWCSTHLFDAFLEQLLRDSDGRRLAAADEQAWAPVMVYINGRFWGMYQLRERLDTWFVADHHDVDPDAIDQVELGWTDHPHWQLEAGSWDSFDALNDYVASTGLDAPNGYAGFVEQVDVANFATLLIAEAYMANTDFWGNNIRMWRAQDGGRWRWMLYDLGHGWPSASYDQLGAGVNYSGEGMPLANALESDEFRALMATLAADYLNTVLSGDNALSRLEAMVALTRPGMEAQLDRWCAGGIGMDDWDAAIEDARSFAAHRADNLREQVRTHLGLGADVQLRVEVDPPGAGRIALTGLTVDAPYVGRYYADVPMTITAVPADGYSFVSWGGDATGSDAALALSLSSASAETTVVARFTK